MNRVSIYALIGYFATGMISIPRVANGISWCESCYEWSGERCGPGTNGDGQSCLWGDAICCIEGGGLCDQFSSDPDWTLVIVRSENCRVEWSEAIEEYLCAGTSWNCSSGGGGGGGGGGCTVSPGEFCPASCPSCTIQYF